MIKVRLMGTVEEIAWMEDQMNLMPQISVLDSSAAFMPRSLVLRLTPGLLFNAIETAVALRFNFLANSFAVIPI